MEGFFSTPDWLLFWFSLIKQCRAPWLSAGSCRCQKDATLMWQTFWFNRAPPIQTHPQGLFCDEYVGKYRCFWFCLNVRLVFQYFCIKTFTFNFRKSGKKKKKNISKQMLAWEAHYLHIRSLQLSPQHPLKVRTSVKTVWNSLSLHLHNFNDQRK